MSSVPWEAKNNISFIHNPFILNLLVCAKFWNAEAFFVFFSPWRVSGILSFFIFLVQGYYCYFYLCTKKRLLLFPNAKCVNMVNHVLCIFFARRHDFFVRLVNCKVPIILCCLVRLCNLMKAKFLQQKSSLWQTYVISILCMYRINILSLENKIFDNERCVFSDELTFISFLFRASVSYSLISLYLCSIV